MNKLVLVVLVFLLACSSSGKMVGTIHMVGNEPFTSLAIINADGVAYKITATRELREHLNKLQGVKVEVEYSDLKEDVTGKTLTVTVVKEVQQ